MLLWYNRRAEKTAGEAAESAVWPMIPSEIITLGLETTCDETGAAIVAGGTRVLSSVVWSQTALHERFGGVVPEIAARAHLEKLNTLVDVALKEAGIAPHRLSAIAVANSPGLVGCLLVGVSAAKGFAFAWDRPLVCVNHVHAHIYAAALGQVGAPPGTPPELPALGLIISGGHSALYRVENYADFRRLGSTLDDAVGEAFDKVAAILQLGYPGGPRLEALARHGNSRAIAFPVSLLAANSLDFSFSGLKTAVRYFVNGRQGSQRTAAELTDSQKADVAASFQFAVGEALSIKLQRALAARDVKSVIVGGGVAANSYIRSRLAHVAEQAGIPLHLPAMNYCTDNAAMIAGLGGQLFAGGVRSGLDAAVVATA